MKKILIIEDDQVMGNVCYNHLMAEGYQTKIASDGESALEILRAFKPAAIILDLMLPRMSGLEVIKRVRADEEFSKIPVIVFTNAYLTNLVQEAWKAGATKCISKSNSSLQEVMEIVRHAIRESNAAAKSNPSMVSAPAPVASSDPKDSAVQSGLQKTFTDGLPAVLATLRASLKNLIKAGSETARVNEIQELCRHVHALAGNAGIAGLIQIAQMADALEALLKELCEKPENINPSTLRTVAAAVDFLGLLFQHGTRPNHQKIPDPRILVVDDEFISRRAIIYALEKARLQSVNVESAEVAYKLLAENPFDLIFLDVDMPGMSGFELCTKLRALPAHKQTPVVFITALSDFENRTSSTMAGGNDFIAKPFLFIELTVKALIHVLRGKLRPVK